MTKIFSLLALFLTIFTSSNSIAEDCSPTNTKLGFDIIKKTDIASKQYKTQKSDVYIEITNFDGGKRKRYFTSIKKRYQNESKNLIKFYEPSNIKNTSLLTYSYDDERDNQQWLYLPSLGSINQLNSSDKNSSFMGSDLTNADIAGRNINKDYHCLISQNDKIYKITSRPKSKEDPYSQLDFIIDRNNFAILQIVFYSNDGSLLKTMNNLEFEKIENLLLVTKSEVKNHKTKGSTILESSQNTINDEINDNEFGVKNLR